MSNLCIIPARIGSKRLKKKNIKFFFGKPIISYAISNAIKSSLFDEIMVSTDSYEIKEIAEKYGASVPFIRKKITSSDFSTTFDVLLEVKKEYELKGKIFDNVCCLYPCTPLLNSEQILEGYKKLIEEKYLSLFSVTNSNKSLFRSFVINDVDKIKFLNRKYEFTRTQDLPVSYLDAGQFYWIKNEIIKEGNSIFTNNTGYLYIPNELTQDIDDEIDWQIAKIKYKKMRG